MTESAMKWGLKKAGRHRREHDFWHPFPYIKEASASDGQTLTFPNPDELDVPADHLRLCFLGTHSHRVNLEMFVEAFRRLEMRGVPATIFLCGKGPVTAALQASAHGLKNVRFPGWLNSQQIQHVMADSDIGVLPYNTPDFFMNTPNKVAEYLSAGLPVLSCTDGEVRWLIEREGCGFWCEPDPETIADTIADISADRSRVAAAAERAVEVFDRVFDRDMVFTKVLEHLSDLAAIHPAADD